MLILIYLLSLSIYSEVYLEDWKVYTSHNNPKDVTLDKNNKLWIATNGGIYNYDYLNKTFKTFNILNGLASNKYKTIIFDSERNIVLAGSDDGVVTIIYNDSITINNLDISNASTTNKSINDINIIDGRVYIVSDRGVHEFLPDVSKTSVEQIFGDTYFQDGLLKIVSFKDSLVVSSQIKGLYTISKNDFLSDPSNWNNLPLKYQNTNLEILDIQVFNEKIHLLTKKNIFYIENDSLIYIKSTKDYDFLNFIEIDGKLKAFHVYGMRDVYSDEESYNFNFTYSKVMNFNLDNTNQLLGLTLENGLVTYDDVKSNFTPNGLTTNAVFDIKISKENNIWVSSGVRGSSVLKNNAWLNFKDFKDKWGNQYRDANIQKSIYISPKNDNVYIGHKGLGQLQFIPTADTFDIIVNNDTNSTLRGVEPFPSNYKPGDPIKMFTEAAETETDQFGVVWSVCFGADYPGAVLVANDGEKWYDFLPYPTGQCPAVDRNYYRLMIDDYGTKWIGSDFGAVESGFILFNDNNTLDDKSDDICQTYRARDIGQLPSNKITSITKDQNGWIWMGTNSGLLYFLNPAAFLYDKNPNSLVPVSNDIISTLRTNDIFVDAINNKWIATNDGVYVLNFDGSEILTLINKDNSPLVDNKINVVSANNVTGEIFIGTDNGLFSVKSLSVAPSESYDIQVYPQPFHTNFDEKIYFDGLIGNSELRIITPKGDLVKVINSLGKKAIWDGKDDFGNFVKSGVYLVLATNGNGNSNAVSKIVILNK